MKLYSLNPYSMKLKLDHVYELRGFHGCTRVVVVLNFHENDYFGIRVLEQAQEILPEYTLLNEDIVVSQKDESYNRDIDVIGKCLGHKDEYVELFI